MTDYAQIVTFDEFDQVREQAGTRDVEKLREGHPYPLRILWEVGYPVDGK